MIDILLIGLFTFGVITLFKDKGSTNTESQPSFDSYSLNDTINRMANAITNFEGGPGDLNYRNNNPGNIKDKYFSGVLITGWIGFDRQGFSIFDSWDNGMNALHTKLYRAFTNQSPVYNSDMTIAEFFHEYSRDQNEALAVALALGVDTNTQLKDLI